MKKIIVFLVAILMLLMMIPLSISAATSTPEIYSHEDRDSIAVSSSEKIVIRFDKVKGADHYWCRVKVLKQAPKVGNVNETALDDMYDFIYDGVTKTRINIYGYDLAGAQGHFMKVYVEARDDAGNFISNDAIYLYLRGDDFESPWEFGILPMKTAKKGDSGNHIKALKQAINIVLGEERLTLTQKFDNATKLALTDAQRLLGIADDAIFGPESRAAFLRFLEGSGFEMQSSDYSPEQAIAYAKQFNGCHPNTGYNKEVYNTYSGNDCANFVSQALIAGGLSITSDFNPDQSVWKTCRYSPTNRTSGLMDYLAEQGYKVYGYDRFTPNGAYKSSPVDINNIKPGDIIFSKGANGSTSGHAMLVDHVEGKRIYYYGHSNNRCGCDDCRNSIGIESIQSHISMGG